LIPGEPQRKISDLFPFQKESCSGRCYSNEHNSGSVAESPISHSIALSLPPMISRLKKSALLSLLLLTAFALSGSAEVKIEKYKAGDWEDDIGYRQAVRVGQLLYITGTAAPGEMTDAVKQVYGDLEKILKAHGLTFKNVVKENLYTTNLDALKANQELRKKHYGKDFPAATWVQVARLFTPELVLEVELVAVFPEEKH
jgi:enamine deaminase RidA (YjgF/YER057c/UK114 family)